MASRYDSQNLPLAPYTPQYDTTLYANILQNKDTQYQQGVQRVQSVYDNVAGLEIYNPTAKQYFQDKFNSLTNRIQALSGADFSNAAIVNQVYGLAAQLGKDPRVQNAVISTQKIKQLQGSQNKKKADGKYAPQAEYVDNQYVQSYLQSNDLDQPYNGPTEASDYLDYNVELSKVLKDLSPTIKYNIGATGKLEYTIDKNSSITPNQIQQVVDGFLATNPKYQQSLQMDALYTYRDVNSVNDFRNKISGFYNKNIEAIENKNKEYQAEVDANPDNIQIQTRNKQWMAENANIINETKSKRDRDLSYFNDPNANLDNLKLTFFNDQLRNTAIVKYQQDNHELDFKETPYANRLVEFVKSGLDPETGLPLSVDSPYYTTFLQNKKSTKGEGSTSTNISGVGDLTTVIGDPEKANKFNFAASDQVKADLQLSKDNYTNILRQSYNAKHPTETTQNQFNSYLAQQEKLFLDTGEADRDYLEYRKLTQPLTTQINGLQELQNEVNAQAAKELPLSNLNKEINLNIGNTKIKINPAQHPQFMNTFKRFYEDVKDYTKKNTTVTDIGQGAVQENPPSTEEAVQATLEKYRNNPDYNLIAKLASDNIYKNAKTILGDFDNLMDARIDRANKLMEERGQRYAYQMNIVEGKKEELDALAKLTSESILANSANKENVDPKDITVIGTYPKGDKQYIRYSVDGKTKDVLYSGTGLITKGYDPNQWLVNSIEQVGHTPYGNGALATDNGKLRYVISKNMWGNGYDVAVLDGDKRIPLNNIKKDPRNPQSEYVKFTHPSQIQGFINDYSSSLNPYTGNPLTREELIQSLINPSIFDSYLKNKYSNQ